MPVLEAANGGTSRTADQVLVEHAPENRCYQDFNEGIVAKSIDAAAPSECATVWSLRKHILCLFCNWAVGWPGLETC